MYRKCFIRKITISKTFVYNKGYRMSTTIQGATNIDDLPSGTNEGVQMTISEGNQGNQPQNTIVSQPPPSYNPNIQSGGSGSGSGSGGAVTSGQSNPQYQQTQAGQIGSSTTNLSQDDMQKILQGLQQASQQNMTTLPSRDVPMNTYGITNDPSIQPNYIPQPQTNVDYIQQNQSMEEMLKARQEKQSKISLLDDVYDTLQIPILLSILFFIFQLPFLNKFLYQYIPLLFIKDGHMAFQGYLFKSILFGSVFIAITKIIQFISVY